MIIIDEKVTGLEDSAKAIGLSYGSPLDTERGMKVMRSLIAKPLNSGEANMLTGVNVQMSIIASIKWWQQAQRYHWFQIVMSQSIMHNIANPKFVLTPNHFAQSEVGELGKTSPVIDAFIKYREDLLSRYKGVTMPPKIKRELIYSVPVGMLEEARVTTNYLQLMTMYAVVVFDSRGMPRCVGLAGDQDEVKKLVDENVTSKDLRVHVYPLPKTEDSIKVIKYKKGISDRL